MAILARALGCFVALGITGIIFPGSCDIGGMLWGTLMLTLLYVFLRPLMQTLTLPFNLLLFGLVTPIADALFLLWTQAWVATLTLNFGQCIIAALLISAAYFPYSAYKQQKLLRSR